MYPFNIDRVNACAGAPMRRRHLRYCAVVALAMGIAGVGVRSAQAMPLAKSQSPVQFNEDIGLNAYYYYVLADIPFWLVAQGKSGISPYNSFF
ncbi:hypothetical protein LRQ11_26760 [Pseudomonas sp. MAFF 311095]|uniref:Hemocyanin middle domain-containing protein n=1 Tax=Pseudomonas petroselini TaxID=2899822 RepID=A0ABS8R053_9PSED|nr:hypothetical protein [Pseudomonas petroselini]MCD7041350.1 hypothetical protein [Pseudomonas petroselini]MCD7046528.1 hypothetical protein [Pseudomonas petroselini]MCD7069683.1 hypothetical protein [Pseudomonas petroselini]MCD7082203.1 hypothetical protein [Pseudomonas petroselini]